MVRVKRAVLLIGMVLIASSCGFIPTSLLANSAADTATAAVCTVCPTPAPCSCALTPSVPVDTPTNTMVPSRTSTSTKTKVPPTATKTPIPPTLTRTPTVTRTLKPSLTSTETASSFTYKIQAGSPKYLRNFAHSDLACNWLGVAGQVFNKSKQAVNNYVVLAEGFVGETPVDQIALTGLSKAYGPGGYEIQLNNAVVDSTNGVFISVYDISGNQLTPPIPVTTFNDCNKNLILINFVPK